MISGDKGSNLALVLHFFSLLFSWKISAGSIALE